MPVRLEQRKENEKNKKIYIAPFYIMKAYKAIYGIDPIILNLDIICHIQAPATLIPRK